MTRRIISLVLAFGLIFQQTGFAQMAVDISKYFAASNATPIDRLRPVHMRYFSLDSASGNLNLILDKGDSRNLAKKELDLQGKEVFDYFLIGLSLPNESFWVNLRPDSPDNMIDTYLAQTNMGKVLLEADLQLKKDTAMFTSPQNPAGRQYWDKLYKKAEALFGSDNITIPTLTRPWIVPGDVIVRHSQDSAYLYKATLKVMLEQDYLKNSPTYNFSDPRLKTLNEYSSQLIRELILPKLNKLVNNASRYAELRQVYYSLILAQWFKSNFSADAAGKYAKLINSRNLTGLTSLSNWSSTEYFKQYQKSFQQGEYNIKEPHSGLTGATVRTYFSGGIKLMSSPATNIIGNGKGFAPALLSTPNFTAFQPGTGIASSPLQEEEGLVETLRDQSIDTRPAHMQEEEGLVETLRDQSIDTRPAHMQRGSSPMGIPSAKDSRIKVIITDINSIGADFVKSLETLGYQVYGLGNVIGMMLEEYNEEQIIFAGPKERFRKDLYPEISNIALDKNNKAAGIAAIKQALISSPISNASKKTDITTAAKMKTAEQVAEEIQQVLNEENYFGTIDYLEDNEPKIVTALNDGKQISEIKFRTDYSSKHNQLSLRIDKSDKNNYKITVMRDSQFVLDRPIPKQVAAYSPISISQFTVNNRNIEVPVINNSLKETLASLGLNPEILLAKINNKSPVLVNGKDPEGDNLNTGDKVTINYKSPLSFLIRNDNPDGLHFYRDNYPANLRQIEFLSAIAKMMGITTNLSIFKNTAAKGGFNTQIAEAIVNGSKNAQVVYDQVTMEAFTPYAGRIQELTAGKGTASYEVPPHFIHDVKNTVKYQAIIQALNSKAVMVKTPLTAAGLQAVVDNALNKNIIRDNLTLMFGFNQWLDAQDAELDKLETRINAGLPIDDYFGVDSFFLSRTDIFVYTVYKALRDAGVLTQEDQKEFEEILDLVAVSMAKTVGRWNDYIYFGKELPAQTVRNPRLETLRERFINIKKRAIEKGLLKTESSLRSRLPLWASTQVKEPDIARGVDPLLYFVNLIGRGVNTMPDGLIEAIEKRFLGITDAQKEAAIKALDNSIDDDRIITTYNPKGENVYAKLAPNEIIEKFNRLLAKYTDQILAIKGTHPFDKEKVMNIKEEIVKYDQRLKAAVEDGSLAQELYQKEKIELNGDFVLDAEIFVKLLTWRGGDQFTADYQSSLKTFNEKITEVSSSPLATEAKISQLLTAYDKTKDLEKLMSGYKALFGLVNDSQIKVLVIPSVDNESLNLLPSYFLSAVINKIPAGSSLSDSNGYKVYTKGIEDIKEDTAAMVLGKKSEGSGPQNCLFLSSDPQKIETAKKYNWKTVLLVADSVENNAAEIIGHLPAPKQSSPVSAVEIMSKFYTITQLLGIKDSKRIAQTFLRSLDPVAFVQSLADATGRSTNEIAAELKKNGLLTPLAADYKLRTAKSLDQREFKNRFVNVSVEPNEVSIQGKQENVANQPLSEYLKTRRDYAGSTAFVFRDNMQQFVARFLGQIVDNPDNPDLLSLIEKTDTFLSTLDAITGIKYVITSGIGANEMYSHQLAQVFNEAMNTYYKGADNKAQWLVMNNPADLQRIPADANNYNTVIFEMSRSGTTKETLDFFNATKDRFKRRIVAANPGKNNLNTLAIELQKEPGASILTIDDTRGDIGGRQMNRRTLMTYVPLYLALVVGLKDKAQAKEHLKEYVQALFDANAKFAYWHGLESQAVQLAEFLFRHRASGRNKFSVIYDDSLKASAKELFQLVNEGANKNIAGGSNNNILLSYSLNQDRALYETVFDKAPESQLPIFILNKGSANYDRVLNDIKKLEAKGIPAIVITADVRLNIKDDLRVIAQTSALLQDMVIYFTYITNQDANSNPAVKFVREITAAMFDIVKDKKARGEQNINISFDDVVSKIKQKQDSDNQNSQNTMREKIDGLDKTAQGLPASFISLSNSLVSLAQQLNIEDETIITEAFITALSKNVVMTDVGEAGANKVSDINAAFGLSEIASLGQNSPAPVIPALNKQKVLSADDLNSRVSVAVSPDSQFEPRSLDLSEQLAEYLTQMYSLRKDKLQQIALTYMEMDQNNPTIKEIAKGITAKFADLNITVPLLALPGVAHTGIEAIMSHPENAFNIAIVYTGTYSGELGEKQIDKNITLNDATYVYGISNVIRMALGGTPSIIFEVKNNQQLGQVQAIINKAMGSFRGNIASSPVSKQSTLVLSKNEAWDSVLTAIQKELRSPDLDIYVLNNAIIDYLKQRSPGIDKAFVVNNIVVHALGLQRYLEFTSGNIPQRDKVREFIRVFTQGRLEIVNSTESIVAIMDISRGDVEEYLPPGKLPDYMLKNIVENIEVKYFGKILQLPEKENIVSSPMDTNIKYLQGFSDEFAYKSVLAQLLGKAQPSGAGYLVKIVKNFHFNDLNDDLGTLSDTLPIILKFFPVSQRLDCLQYIEEITRKPGEHTSDAIMALPHLLKLLPENDRLAALGQLVGPMQKLEDQAAYLRVLNAALTPLAESERLAKLEESIEVSSPIVNSLVKEEAKTKLVDRILKAEGGTQISIAKVKEELGLNDEEIKVAVKLVNGLNDVQETGASFYLSQDAIHIPKASSSVSSPKATDEASPVTVRELVDPAASGKIKGTVIEKLGLSSPVQVKDVIRKEGAIVLIDMLMEMELGSTMPIKKVEGETKLSREEIGQVIYSFNTMIVSTTGIHIAIHMDEENIIAPELPKGTASSPLQVDTAKITSLTPETDKISRASLLDIESTKGKYLKEDLKNWLGILSRDIASNPRRYKNVGKKLEILRWAIHNNGKIVRMEYSITSKDNKTFNITGEVLEGIDWILIANMKATVTLKASSPVNTGDFTAASSPVLINVNKTKAVKLAGIDAASEIYYDKENDVHFSKMTIKYNGSTIYSLKDRHNNFGQFLLDNRLIPDRYFTFTKESWEKIGAEANSYDRDDDSPTRRTSIVEDVLNTTHTLEADITVKLPKTVSPELIKQVLQAYQDYIEDLTMPATLENLNSFKVLKKTIESWKTASSPVNQPENGKTGGIDFRYINMVTQAQLVPSKALLKLPDINTLKAINPDTEAINLNKMMSAGIMPAPERVIEFVSACYLKESPEAAMEKSVPCLVEFLKLQEQELAETPAEFKAFLAFVDSNKIAA